MIFLFLILVARAIHLFNQFLFVIKSEVSCNIFKRVLINSDFIVLKLKMLLHFRGVDNLLFILLLTEVFLFTLLLKSPTHT